jgi:hypothetical protein
VSLLDSRGITHHVPEDPQTTSFTAWITWTTCGQDFDYRVSFELYKHRDVDCMACMAAGIQR